MTTTSTPPRTAPRAWPLAVLSSAAGLDAGSVAILGNALPAMGRAFDATPRALSWTVTGYAVAFAGLLLGGGALADRFRRRRVLVAGLALLAAGSALALAAPGLALVAVGRAVQGAGAAITVPAATALVTDLHPAGPSRARALGIFASAQAASYGTGLVLGGVLTSAAGWRWVFAFQAAAALLLVPAALRALPAGTPGSPRRLDVAGAAALTVAIVAVVLAADLAAQGAAAVPALLVAALAAGVWWRRSGTGAALVDRALPRIRSVRTAALTAVAFYFCVQGSLFFVPLYLQDVRGMPAAASGLAVLPVSVAVAVTAALSGRPVARLGLRVVLPAGLVLTGGGVLLWCLTGPDSPYGWPVLPGLVLTGAGQGLAFPAITALGLRDVPSAAHGTASAITATALQVGSATGPAVLTAVAATADGLRGVHLAYAAATAVAVAASLVAVRPSAARGAPGTRGEGQTITGSAPPRR
ncbi:MFS transporter [Actinomadura kijaniata]|uniref:MFS transporter n=1 Tax=Actinomadura kijaniata TaxID=46161 RepID=UPI003F1B2957